MDFYVLAFVLIALESFLGVLWRKFTKANSNRLQQLMIREALVESRERQLKSDLQDLEQRQQLFHREQMLAKIDAGTAASESTSTSTSAPPSARPSTSASTSTSASACGGEQVGDEQKKDIAREHAFQVLKSLYCSYDALWSDVSGAITGETVQACNPDTMRRFNDLTYWQTNEVNFARDIAFLVGVIVKELDVLRSEKLPVLCQVRRGPCRK
ncbi:hypothetical protein BSKO_10418 [Bryopsis sp. KO-2023]|nr:hypothetical protein BSKO_10418 [Bryopsis sp. KO-2023]